MAFNPEIHQRRSIRLKGYDYSNEGVYFVTICTKDREHLFGEIIKKHVINNPAGEMVRKTWMEIPYHYPGFNFDCFVVMPNHFHGIVIKDYVGTGPCACPDFDIDSNGATTGNRPYNLSLSDILMRFKSLTTNKYIEGINNHNWRKKHTRSDSNAQPTD